MDSYKINKDDSCKVGLIFLDHQAALWDGKLRAFEKARHVGEIIKPKSREVQVVQENKASQRVEVDQQPSSEVKVKSAQKAESENQKGRGVEN